MDNEEVVELVFDDGESISVRAVVLDPEREVSFERLQLRAGKLMDSLTSIAGQVRGKFSELSPDEVTLVLKASVGVEAGKAIALIGDGKADTAIEVTLKWTK